MLADAVSTAACMSGTVASFPLLEDQTTSILPIMCCIAFGFSLCMFGVASLRWWSSLTLQKYQLAAELNIDSDGGRRIHPENEGEQNELPSASHYSPLQHHIFLLSEVISMKQRGAAGGHHSRIRGMP